MPCCARTPRSASTIRRSERGAFSARGGNYQAARERRFGETLHSWIVAACSRRLCPVDKVDAEFRPIGIFSGLGKDRCDVRGEIYAQPSPSFSLGWMTYCVLCNAYCSPRGPPPRGLLLRHRGVSQASADRSALLAADVAGGDSPKHARCWSVLRNTCPSYERAEALGRAGLDNEGSHR